MTRDTFRCFARAVDNFSAHPIATAVAFVLIVGWALLGHVFRYSDTWQLVINTLSSVVTFLMVFIIASAQKRDTDALNLKLDMLISANGNLSRAIGIEFAPEEEVQQLRKEIAALALTRGRIRGEASASRDQLDSISLPPEKSRSAGWLATERSNFQLDR